MTRKKILLPLFVLLIIASGIVYFCNKSISDSVEGKLYTETSGIPANRTGLLLGTPKYLNNGKFNPYYVHRVDAAARLMKAGKIKYLIISGDSNKNGQEYNEPETMREDLFMAGIHPSMTYVDYAGVRTFDSLVRLKEIFGQDSVTIISQPLHNERAIYLAKKLGISAIGFNAKDAMNPDSKTPLREKLVRVKVYFDFLFGKVPEVRGEKVRIPA